MNKRKSSLFFAVCIYFLAGIFCTSAGFSQSIPPFQMTLDKNKVFKASDLAKGRPLILIYFDPDCDHCQKLMNELFKKINDFKRSQIVMVTFKPLVEVAAFEKKYQAKKYSNIKVGTEGTRFYLRMYYGLMKMPFTALYDKKGNLNYSYREETPVDDLIRRLKTL